MTKEMAESLPEAQEWVAGAQKWMAEMIPWVEERVAKGDYIIRFEWVEPLSEWQQAVFVIPPVYVDCSAGDMDVLPASFLEHIRLFPSLHPGDKIYFIEHVWSVPAPDGDEYFLAATRGSMGTVVSYDEYCERMRKTYDLDAPGDKFAYIRKWLEEVKERMGEDEYIIRLEAVAPLAEPERVDFERRNVHVDCQAGDMDLFPVVSLQKVMPQ
jgi:hypothetical protein